MKALFVCDPELANGLFIPRSNMHIMLFQSPSATVFPRCHCLGILTRIKPLQ